MYVCPYLDLEVLDLYSLVLPSLGRIEVVIPTIKGLLVLVSLFTISTHPLPFSYVFNPTYYLTCGMEDPTRAFVGQASLFICVSALSCLGCVCLPETSSTAINTIQCIWKWNEYLWKAHSWKVVFFNINEWNASLMKLALKKCCNEIS